MPETAEKTFRIVSAKENADSVTQAFDVQSPLATSETSHASPLSDRDNISQGEPSVKREYAGGTEIPGHRPVNRRTDIKIPGNQRLRRLPGRPSGKKGSIGADNQWTAAAELPGTCDNISHAELSVKSKPSGV